MPEKSTAPYDGPPRWLDAAAELPLSASRTYATPAAFIGACMAALLRVQGVTPELAADVTANACGEAAWGRACWHGNAGGWKITQAYARAHRERHGAPPPWWKARGNVRSADAAWCFYRAFPSLEAFLVEWLAHFVPRPGDTAPYPGYRAAGAAFWRGDARWFGELILVGYKGSPSKKRLSALRAAGKPDATHPSIAAHASIRREVLEVWSQLCLGLDPDGAWGRKSVAACTAFQAAHGLTPTGLPDAPTLAALAVHRWPQVAPAAP
jgi:hypothetical protein